MARIEIPFDEYNEMKEEVNNLNKINYENEKQLINLQKNNVELCEALDEIINSTTFIERVFKWKNIRENVTNLLVKCKETHE